MKRPTPPGMLSAIALRCLAVVRQGRRPGLPGLLVAALLVAATLPPAVAAEPYPRCQAGQPLQFVFGFATLKERLGDTMGEPLECEYADLKNEAMVQQTTTGLAFYRRSTNTPTFTNGYEHWALTSAGLVRWTGESLDPPANARPVAMALPSAILPAQRIVAYYGNPLAPVLGVLGEPPSAQMLSRLREQAEAYAALDPTRPVQPALHLIAVVAQASAGGDGMYRARMAPEIIEQVAQWAQDQGYLLILDVQVGRSSVIDEVLALAPYLRRPYVHLALDPEFAMESHEEPGQVIGSIDAATINGVVQVLSDIVVEENLSPKVLIVHRFVESMVTNHHAIHPTPHVQVVIDMDGFGSPAAKISKYRDLVRDQPVQYAGIKLFYQQDAPLLSPQEVLALAPAPDLVIYQ